MPVTVEVTHPIWGPLGTVAFWLIVPCFWVLVGSLYLRYRSRRRAVAPGQTPT